VKSRIAAVLAAITTAAVVATPAQAVTGARANAIARSYARSHMIHHGPIWWGNDSSLETFPFGTGGGTWHVTAIWNESSIWTGFRYCDGWVNVGAKGRVTGHYRHCG
jgi:hypothetical protein